MKNLLIVIPVYNEERNIEILINDWIGVLKENEMDLLLIDDGSKDRSCEIIKNFKKDKKNILLIEKANSGHGDSIIVGYNFAVEQSYNHIFQVDSDNQFSASDFNLLWSSSEKDNDLILGNRKTRNDPIFRVFLSKIILKMFIKILFFKNIKDANVPFRLIKVNFLKKFLTELNFKPIAPNILMSIYSRKHKTVDIKHFSRKHGEITWSLKKLFKFGLKLLADLLKFRHISK